MHKENYFLYLLIISTSAIFLIAHVFILNYLYDPWWHFGGNKIGISYSFHERESKINRLQQQIGSGKKFNCIVLGSSRILTFDQNRIKNYSCYNFSVSSGTYPLLLSYTHFFREQGQDIKLIIMGIDNWQLTRKLPEITQVDPPKQPASWYDIYFALDALRYSKRIANKYRVIIGYEDHWTPTAGLRNNNTYPIDVGWKNAVKVFDKPEEVVFYPGNLLWLKQFRKDFPKAKLAGFLTPMSPDHLAKVHANGGLLQHIEMVYHAAKYFDIFHDFTIPNKLTRNPENSWDGSHYKPLFTDYVVRALLEGESSLSVDVKSIDYEPYVQKYIKRLQRQMKKNLSKDLFEKHSPVQLIKNDSDLKPLELS